MKILLFTDSLGGGGKERRMGELIKGLVAKGGYEIEIATMDTKIGYSIFLQLNIPIHFLIRTIAWDPVIFWRLYRLCKRFKPDVIHTWDPMTSLYAAPIAKLLGIIFVNGMITIAPSRVNKMSVRWLLNRINMLFSSIILSNSRAGLRSFNAPRNKSAVIYNGFDFERVANVKGPGALQRDVGLDGYKIVGMVASFTIHKDYDTFLTLAKAMIRRRSDIAFVAIGDGPDYQRHKKSLSPDESARIKLLGRIDNVESYVNVFDVGMLLTNNRVVGEGISNSIMEYMALGKPVVATDSGGTKEILTDKKTGFLCENNDIEGIIRNIDFLADNPATAREMGMLGRERIRKDFLLDDMVRKFIDVYQTYYRRDGELLPDAGRTNILFISEVLFPPFDEGIKIFSRSILASLVARPELGVRAITTHGMDIDSLNLHRYKINKFLFSLKMRRGIKLKSPKIIIYIPGSSITPVSLFRVFLLHFYALGAKIVVVGLQPRTLNLSSSLIIRYLLRNALFLVQSNSTREYLMRTGCNADLVPSGVDVTKFKPVSSERKNELRKKYHLDPSLYVILHVGHLNTDRNIQSLIEIQGNDKNQIIVVGSTSTAQNNALLTLMEGSGILVYKDYIAEIEELYQLSDCFVFPVHSKTNAIEFPLSVLEALACNLPVVATRFSGLVTFIRESASFRYFDDDTEIKSAIDMVKKATKIDNRTIAEIFSWDTVTANMLKKIDEAIKK